MESSPMIRNQRSARWGGARNLSECLGQVYGWHDVFIKR